MSLKSSLNFIFGFRSHAETDFDDFGSEYLGEYETVSETRL
jgi:hypothetical protein